VSHTDLHAVNGKQSADISSVVAALYHARDPGHCIEAGKAATIPPAGQGLTGAELRLLPPLSTNLSFPEIAGELSLSRNTHQVTSDLDLPQAGYLLPQPGSRPVPRAWTPGELTIRSFIHQWMNITRNQRGPS
jgi:hypothetical protein